MAEIIISESNFEEEVLKAGLEGYEAYMKRVKYRMIPLIW